VSTIAEWLTSLGLSEYTDCFVENHIDESIIRELTDQDLKDLGVMSLGHGLSSIAPCCCQRLFRDLPAASRSPRASSFP
jgi:hypothetical protein